MRIVTSDPVFYIKNAVNAYLNLIKTTYGPAGKQILIADEYTVKSVDDGKLAAQDFELKDEFENAVIKYIREVTEKTEKRVGDGTTTSAILMSSLVNLLLPDAGLSSFKPNVVNVPQESLKIRKGLVEAIDYIKKAAKKIKTEKELYEVVYNAYNNEEMAKLISSTLYKIGKDGVLSVEDSRSMVTETETIEGLEIDKGYVSPYFANKGVEVHLQKCPILVYNGKLDSAQEVMPFVQKLLASGTNLLTIVADDYSEEIIALFVMNKLKGVFNPLLIKAPGYGDLKTKYLEDLAVVTGAKLIDPAITKLQDVELDVLGAVESVRSKKDETIFIGGKGKKADIKAHVEAIRAELTDTNQFEKERYEKRIAQLTDGIALIKIGAHTEAEQKTIKAKVEDAVNAGKVALQEGIVLGAGKTYAEIKTSSAILNEALKAPRKQLIENGEDMLDDKVFDPALVLIAALESAVSVALGLVNTGGIIAVKREDKTPAF